MTAIQIDPEYADAYLRLGVVYSEQELFDEAAEQFKKSTEYDLKIMMHGLDMHRLKCDR